MAMQQGSRTIQSFRLNRAAVQTGKRSRPKGRGATPPAQAIKVAWSRETSSPRLFFSSYSSRPVNSIMPSMKAILLLFSLLPFSSSGSAQDKPTQAAVVESFKQEIHEFLNTENPASGIEHARVVSSESIAPVHAKRKMVRKDGTPCGAFHSGWCHDVWVDDFGEQYTDSKGKGCNPEQHTENCLAWARVYDDPVLDFSFDVRVTDSLVTPYTGILSYKRVSHSTAGHATKEGAAKDSDFGTSVSVPLTLTYGYQDGKWKLLKL